MTRNPCFLSTWCARLLSCCNTNRPVETGMGRLLLEIKTSHAEEGFIVSSSPANVRSGYLQRAEQQTFSPYQPLPLAQSANL